MRKFKATSFTELGILTIMVVGLSFMTVSIFGDNLSEIFMSNKVSNRFVKDRVLTPETENFYISKAKFNLNGKDYKAPVEKVLLTNLKSAELIEVAGTRGNIKELASILQAYVSQIEEIIKELPEGADSSEYMKALETYKNNIDSYESQNNSEVTGTTDPVIELVSGLDLSITLDEDGESAVKLNAELANLASKLPSSDIKNLLIAYTNDLQNLGKSIDFTLDSRCLELLGLRPEKTKLEETSDLLNSVFEASIEKHTKDYIGLDLSVIMEATPHRDPCDPSVIECIREKDEHSVVLNILEFMESQGSSDLLDPCTFNYLSRMSCWNKYDIPYYNLNGEELNQMLRDDGQFMFKNGMSLTFELDTNTSATNAPRYVFVDLDGPFAGENTMGKDLYVLNIFANKIVPYGDPAYPMTIPNHYTAEDYSPNQTCIPGNTDKDNTGWPCGYEMINKSKKMDKKTLREKILEFLKEHPDMAAELLKGLKIFRNGNYEEIATKTYNTDALCHNLDAEIVDNKCTFDMP